MTLAQLDMTGGDVILDPYMPILRYARLRGRICGTYGKIEM